MKVSILREAIQAESSSPSPGAGGDDWQSAIDKEQIDETELENSYTEEMGDLRFDSAELQDNHCYQSNATHALDARLVRFHIFLCEALLRFHSCYLF